jgi:Ubiquitin-2 like Rad60 SUMO-like
MFPGKPRPVWVACDANETVAALRNAIAEKGNLQADQIVLVFDDAELDVQDVVRLVIKNEVVIVVEMQ